MTSFKEQWNLAMALEVLKSQTVDSTIWAEATRWLMLYGPPEIQEIIGQASSLATREYFPEVTPRSYTEAGEPCYDIRDIAYALGVTEEEALAEIGRLETRDGVRILITDSGTRKLQ